MNDGTVEDTPWRPLKAKSSLLTALVFSPSPQKEGRWESGLEASARCECLAPVL